LSAITTLPVLFIAKEFIMVKKLKSLSENQLTQTVKDSAHQIWLAGLGAFAKTQEEGNKVFEALVKEGEAIQKKTRKLADEKMSDVRKSADRKVSSISDKASGTWDRLEQVFEDRVARALSSLGVPTKKDIDRLSKRVAELTEVVQKLHDAQGGAVKKVAKPAAAKVAAKPAAKPAVKATAVPAATKAVAKAAPAKKPAPTKSLAAAKPAEPDNAPAGAATAA
jgi:poly(hydroxyalkanoate) granule-associated protein